MAQFHRAMDVTRAEAGRGVGVVDRRCGVEHLEHPLPRRGTALQQVGHPAERDHRPGQHHQVGVEGHQLAHGHTPGDHVAAAQPQHQQHPDAHQQAHHREKRALDANERAVAPHVLVVGGREPPDLVLLTAVGAHDAHARQGFLGDGADGRELLLDGLEAFVDGFADHVDQNRERRQRDEGQQRETPVERQHQRDDRDEREHGVRQVHERGPDHHAHGVQVVGGPRHQVAGAIALEVAGLQALQRREEVVTQVELDVARHADDQAALKEAEHTTHGRQAEGEPGVEANPVGSDAGRQVVDGVLQHPRAGQ